MNKVTVFVNARRGIHVLHALWLVTACCVFRADKDTSKAEYFCKTEILNVRFYSFQDVGEAK